MYRLNVHMVNGNETSFDFFTLTEAEAYRDARSMATNRHIARTWISYVNFKDCPCSAHI